MTANRAASAEDIIKSRAVELGFDLVGIARALPSENADYVRQWLASGQAGNMAWMHQHVEKMLDIGKLLPGAKSVVSVALNYHYPVEEGDSPDAGRIARYALGDDYHDVMKDRLHDLADFIRAQLPGTITKCGVDSSPILEREFAAAAGIGWIGKNACIIHPQVGSWLFLGEVITTADLQCDQPMPDHCGTCTKCLEACPTGALTGPGNLDARKCISYLTIEHREPLSPQQQTMIGDWLIGCDICQEVCPFNRKAPESHIAELRPRFPAGRLPLDQVLAMDEDAHRATFRRSAARRVKLPVLQANARAVLANRRARA